MGKQTAPVVFFVIFSALHIMGCGSRPRAPALQDGSVYQNDREGFRFLVPDGWVQQAKANVPDDKLDQERLLVLYRSFKTSPPGSLEVTAMDLPADVDLAEFLQGRPSGGQNWRLDGDPEALSINGVDATLFKLQGVKRPSSLAREVVTFRRGGRVYFLTSTFSANDIVRRDQARGAAASVQWSK
jgi:hypothetical protein